MLTILLWEQSGHQVQLVLGTHKYKHDIWMLPNRAFPRRHVTNSDLQRGEAVVYKYFMPKSFDFVNHFQFVSVCACRAGLAQAV
jgi:hypothetical protein